METEKLYQVYVLQNAGKRFYIGLSEDVAVRLEQHNRGESKWTKSRGPWSLVKKRLENFRRCAQAGNPFEETKGWSRILRCDWFATLVSPIIPQGGIPGSNPGPATNFNPAASRQGLYYVQRNTLPGLCSAKRRRAVLHRVE